MMGNDRGRTVVLCFSAEKVVVESNRFVQDSERRLIDVETLVGSTLGGYTVTRVIGTGGMGTVYLAEDKAIGQQVAIKVVKTEDSEYADIMSIGQVAERFRQEARAVASLDHLHILPLYRYGEEKTPAGLRSYMVMQYRPEGSLWAWLRRRAGLTSRTDTRSALLTPPGLPTGWPLQADEVADYVCQAAAALQYAHDRGFIHRDVKPENFLLRFDKNPIDNSYKAFLLLSDFGLAKFFSNLASNSQILGTPTYMAPEQFSGIASPESDQYALAVMAYCLLAGQPPFSGDPIHLMNQHLTTQPPSIRHFVPTLSEDSAAVLDKALAKIPSERYTSITEFADAFARTINEGPENGSTSLSSRPLFSLPAHVQRQQELADKGTGTVLPLQTPESPIRSNGQSHSQQPGNLPEASPVAGDQTAYKQQPAAQKPLVPVPLRIEAASQPQQRQQAIIVEPHTDISLYSDNTQQQGGEAQSRQSGQVHPKEVSRRSATKWIVGGVAVVAVGASAAGIYFSKQTARVQSKGHITAASTKSVPQKHTLEPHIKSILHGHEQAVSSLVWSPDGFQLASGSLDRSVRIWQPGQADAILIIRQHQMSVQTVAWKPTGAQIASGGRDGNIQICSTTDGTLSQSFTSKSGIISSVVWSQDGAEIFVGTVGGGLQKIVLNARTIGQEGPKVSLRTLALSPDGRYLALGTESGFITILTLSTLRRTFTTRVHQGSIRALEWSPDSTQLASGGIDKTIQVLDVTTQQIAHSSVYTSIINGLAWKPNESNASAKLAIALASGEMQTWSLSNNSHAIYKGHTAAVTTISWSTKGLATGSSDKTIILWNI